MLAALDKALRLATGDELIALAKRLGADVPFAMVGGTALVGGIGEQIRPLKALKGLTFVISGTFAKHSRDEYKAMIEQHGGKNSGSVSGKTSYILAGENMGPAKLEKAAKLNVKILHEDEFLLMLNE